MSSTEKESEVVETEHNGESPSPGHRDQGQIDRDVLPNRDVSEKDKPEPRIK